jgi:hypothetical protein
MNYDKLKEILKNNKYSISKASHAIGRTEGWFHRAAKTESMTIADLEKLLKLCKTNLFEFFGGQPSYHVANEPNAKESELVQENNELLRENRQLRLKIEELEGKSKPQKVKEKPY